MSRKAPVRIVSQHWYQTVSQLWDDRGLCKFTVSEKHNMEKNHSRILYSYWPKCDKNFNENHKDTL